MYSDAIVMYNGELAEQEPVTSRSIIYRLEPYSLTYTTLMLQGWIEK